MSGIADQPARDAIVADLDRTLFVEAGAGSGKTASLVGRFVALVTAGVDVTEIAAITFTEAAAAELRARVRETLEDIAAGTPRNGPIPSGRDADRARAALEDLDRATLSTLHSFAQRVLAAAPIEASLPPLVDVHDEISSALRSSERWNHFVAELIESEDRRVTLRAALALGVSVDQLESVAATLNQNWDLLVGVDQSEARTPVTADELAIPIDEVERAAAAVLALADGCLDQDDKLCQWIRENIPGQLADLRAAIGDPYSLLASTRGLADRKGVLTPVPKNRGGAKAWPDGTKSQTHDLWDHAITVLVDARQRIADRVLGCLGAELAAYTLREAAGRRAEGRLEFHDLLVLARSVLRAHESVRRRMHDRYRYLLLDEFQDTDPIQVELAVRIAADPGHDPTVPWDEVDVEPGRLFFVGDPKQSIYRFRRADIDLFARAGDRHRDGALRLVTNFRTVAPILACCNELFGHLIAEEVVEDPDGGPAVMAQPAYTPLAPARHAIADDPGPAVVFIGSAEPDASADTLRRAEAHDVASTLGAARADGWLVHPAGASAPRPCGWSDMAVLLPSRASLPHLRRAFHAAGVPYRLETGSLVYATTEIRDVLSILRAIDDPGDAVSIVGALRSPAYGCGDDDLLAWYRAVGSWSYLGIDERVAALDPAADVPSVVARALQDLERWHRRRTFERVPALVDGLIRERQLMASTIAGGRHRDSWRLYRVMVEHARQFAETDGGGLAAFLRWAEVQSDDKLRVTAPVLPEADLDAVRVMTVHGAKGLEFPIAVVSGMSGLFPRPQNGPQVHFQPSGGFDVRIGRGIETGRFDSRRTVEDVMGAHEGIRLLYVALTRARDHLVVTTHHKPAKQIDCHAARIGEALATLGWSTDAAPFGVVVDPGSSSRKVDHVDDGPRSMVDVAPVGATITADAARAWSESVDRWADDRRALLAGADSAGVVSATTLGTFAGDERDDRDLDVGSDGAPDPGDESADADPWRRGRLGTNVGSAVHAVLEHVDLSDPDGADVDGLARWQAEVHAVPDAADSVAARVRSALASDLVRRAVASGRWWRELHVGVPLSTVADHEGDAGLLDLFEGFVDLAFETADGLVVVDYKTDAAADHAAAARVAERYQTQGAAYAVAIEAATGRRVAAVHFLFLGDQGSHDVAVVDLDQRCDEVRAMLAGLLVEADRP